MVRVVMKLSDSTNNGQHIINITPMSSSQLHNTFRIPVTNNGQHIKIVQSTVKKVSGEWSMVNTWPFSPWRRSNQMYQQHIF